MATKKAMMVGGVVEEEWLVVYVRKNETEIRTEGA
jgi:hypothetical protein